MSIVIRDVREHELDSVLALNNNAGLAILPLDSAKVRRFFETAEYFRVAERDGNLAGFLVGFGSGAAHDSSNFAWFGERYPQLACEVFLDHGADPALLFHGSFGFREVGQHVMAEANVRASMLMKELCSYPWVRDTYGDALPDVAWARTRLQADTGVQRPTGT